MLMSNHHVLGAGAVGLNAVMIANAKCSVHPIEAFFSGIMCNALVCLAVWLCYSCRTTTDKILAIIFPITAFVAAGFEHCVANMYFVPMGILLKHLGPGVIWEQSSVTADQFVALNWSQFIVSNLIPVTLGNIVGGAGLVGLVYWRIHVKK
jgi:formate/nitrite transporter